MDLEKRIAELETRLDEQERKRRDLSAQLIALQLVFAKTLPLIATSSADQFDSAIHQAKTAAENGLLLAGLDTEELSAVLDAIDALHDDLLAPGQHQGQAPCH